MHKRNHITIEGDVATIRLTKGQETVVDTDVLPLVTTYTWHASWRPRPGRYYVACPAYNPATGKTTTIYLHRVITGAPKGKVVDHWNHDTLDNRRANLKVGTQKDNMQNGKNAHATHCPSGHPYDETNTYREPGDGTRRCRTCNRDRGRRFWLLLTPEQRKQHSYIRYHANKNKTCVA